MYHSQEKNAWHNGKDRKWTIERVCAINIQRDISAQHLLYRHLVEHICANGKYIFTFVSLLHSMYGWKRAR